jgi:hypothetical protein
MKRTDNFEKGVLFSHRKPIRITRHVRTTANYCTTWFCFVEPCGEPSVLLCNTIAILLHDTIDGLGADKVGVGHRQRDLPCLARGTLDVAKS